MSHTRNGAGPGPTGARTLPLAAIFGIGLGAGLWLWPHLSLPYTNPWSIVGRPALEHYHPANNVLRFLVLLACPAVLLVVVYRWLPAAAPQPAPPEPPRTHPFHAALLVALAVLAALNLPTYHAWGEMNRFHEGESLGTAVSHLAGQVPYQDYLFVHGVWQDPLRAAVAFRLFGRSIASARILESSAKIVAFALLALVLLEWLGALGACAALLLIVGLHGLVALEAMWLPLAPLRIMPRDWTAIAFLLALVKLWRALERQGRTPAAAFFTSFIPVACFGYSIDRGFFLTATALVATVLLYGLFLRGREALGWFWLSVGAGALAGTLAVGHLLHWRFRAFWEFTFVLMPRYKEWMDGLVYPIEQAPMWGICALATANLFYLVLAWLEAPSVKAFCRRRFFELCLLVASICFFRAALGRSDFVHVAVNSWPIYLLAFALFVRPWPLLLAPRLRKALVATALALAAVCLYRVPAAGLLAENFPAGTPDSRYLPASYLSAAAFLRENLGPGEHFFTLTSEALWYYLVDKPCPARFPVVWFAAPEFYQREIIEALETKRVKYVLYRNQAPSNRLDGISSAERLPRLVEHIRRHYVPDRAIDGHEIWKRAS